MNRGEVYLVDFGKKYNSEFGKTRPTLIIQNNIANRNIDKVDFKGVSVIPMTTALCGGDVRVLVSKRDSLEKDSEICVNEICTLDMSRIDFGKLLTVLNEVEMREVEAKLKRHLGL